MATTVAGREHGLARDRIRDLGRGHELGLVHARATLDGHGTKRRAHRPTERLAAGSNVVIAGAVVGVAVANVVVAGAVVGVAVADEVVVGAVVEVAVAIGATGDAMTVVAAATEAATVNPIFARENVPRVTSPSGVIGRLRTLANAVR
jgi:hypothetical protein